MPWRSRQRQTVLAPNEAPCSVRTSSAGGPGNDRYVDELIAIIQGITTEQGYRFKIAAICVEVPRDTIHTRLDESRVTECSSFGDLGHAAITEATTIMAQMGAKPFARVLDEHPDVDIVIGGIRDTILLGQLDSFIDNVRSRVTAFYPQLGINEAAMIIHCFGSDAVMEPMGHVVPHEIGLLGEVTAPTQELANAICSQARVTVLRMPYPRQMATAGNFALPLDPPESPIGPVCRFTVLHLMEVDDARELFRIRIHAA